jgi:hypothetical protein
MLQRLKKHVSPATVIAMVALIVALGGTAVAGGVLNKKKVNTIIDNRAPGLTVLKAKSADSAGSAGSAKADNVFGAETGDGATLTQATLPGTTVTKASNTHTIHFPRAVVGCVVTGSGLFDGNTSVVRSGTANPNDVILANPSGTSVEAIVVCP